MKKWLLLAMLLALPASGQDETFAPLDDLDDNSAVQIYDSGDCAGTTCDTTNCANEVDEDPTTPDGTYLNPNVDTASTFILFSMPDPSDNLDTGVEKQSLETNMTRLIDPGSANECDEATGGTNPPYTIKLFCNGVDKGEILTLQTIAGLDTLHADILWTYTTDGDCDAAGANVEFQFELRRAGGGSNRRTAALNAFEWNVTHAAVGGRRRVHSVSWLDWFLGLWSWA